jgi:hypothetical protein
MARVALKATGVGGLLMTLIFFRLDVRPNCRTALATKNKSLALHAS